jgi:hypothetical protein
MNTKEIATSTPYTVQNYDNYLKDYVNTSGFQWDSKCLDVAFRNLGNNFEKYIQKVGDYNTVGAFNPQYHPPRSYQEKDYDKPCPEGWTGTNHSWWGGNYTTCKNINYTGPCNNVAGRTLKKARNPTCPGKNYGNPQSYTRSYWSWWRRSWNRIPYFSYEKTEYQEPNNNYYTGWYGPTDASQGDFSNSNIGRKNQGEGSYCHAGWAAGNSEGGSRADCQSSGGTWVNYYSDPNFNSHGYTCYKPTQYYHETENQSYFGGHSADAKRNWENQCQAYWPMKTINIPEKWTCTYGDKLENDIASGKIFLIGYANSPGEAAKIGLKSNRMKDNYFYMLDTGVYIIGPKNDVGVITSKGNYEQNCKENNNRKGTLYMINQEFFNMLQNCKTVNDKINDVNINRDILQNAITSFKENFNGENDEPIIENFSNEEIIKNQNEIISNLTSNYNKKAELYNAQVDLIGQNEKIIEDNNKKLNKQLDDLVLIQDQITLKDRVIELNEQLTKKQIRNKKILIGFFTLLPFLIIPILLIYIKSVSSFTGFSLVGLMIVVYIIYIIVITNQSDVKNFGREDKRIITNYEKSIKNYWDKQKKSIKNFINENCPNEEDIDYYFSDEDKSDSSKDKDKDKVIYPKGDYLIKSNGPFYYYDGSAPPQQVYPGAVGSIQFGIENKNYKFPKDIEKILNNIKNPITQFFFYTWMNILIQNGIKVDDPRFAQDLNVIDFSDSDQTPMPFWDNIKLPIVTNIDNQFNYLFQSYSGEKKKISKNASVLLADLWNFIFGDQIPGDIYQNWTNKLAVLLKNKNPNIEKFYQDYLEELIKLPKFTEKYGEGDKGLMKFAELKMVDFIKTFNKDIHVSQSFSKKIDL